MPIEQIEGVVGSRSVPFEQIAVTALPRRSQLLLLPPSPISHTQSKASASGSPSRRGLRFSTVNTLKPNRISSTTGDPFFRQPSKPEPVAAASLVIVAPPTPPVAALLDPSVRAPCVAPPQPPTVAP
ncbi:hypothetical protein U1Q18_001820 [Sarracenia purpurea var. burkii]